MREIQSDLPGAVKHFAAVNDRYHAGTRSKHAAGLAFDTSLLDPSKSAEAAEAIRAKIRATGLTDRAFRVIDEYKNPSSRSTGGHLHTQFNSPEAADAYAKAKNQLVSPDIASGSWKKGAGGNGAALAKPTAESLSQSVPSVKTPDTGSAGSGSPVFNINQTIHGGQNTPQEIAQLANRHLQDQSKWSMSDLPVNI